MSRAIESTNAAAAEARPMTSQHLANEVADLMIHQNSPVAAADDFLKQVAMRNGPQQTEFINSFENDLNKQYGQVILPTLLLYSEHIGQSGHNTDSEVALAAATHNTLQQLEVQDYAQGRLVAASINCEVSNFDKSANPIGYDRNAIGPADNSVNGIGGDRNAIGVSNNSSANQSDKFTNVENLLHDNPAIRDWMRQSCGTNQITQADLQGLLSRHRTKLDPARESVYQELSVLNANWNTPEFSKIQSTLPHNNIKYLDMSKVMDIQPVPPQVGSGNPYPY